MIRMSLSSGDALVLKQSPHRKFRGLKIPGSSLYKTEWGGSAIQVHIYEHPLYTITLRHLQLKEANRIITNEPDIRLRMEIPLSGTLSILPKEGSPFQSGPGYYHLTDQPIFASEHAGGAPIIYLTVHFSQELLSSLGSDHPFVPVAPAPVPKDLLEMIYDILKCPFQGTLRDFYYANKVREVLFSHTVALPVVPPGELSPEQIARMYEADRIMANNLDGKITIPQLARQLGTNFVTLKRNYEKVFGIGIFPRLMQRKMQHIQLLLEKTTKPLKEIADLAGYQTLPGFINAFRKRFKMTPNDWRKERRGF